ncbi:MAG: carbohydrate-binding protein, partial [Candidatus Promineifilaceae bacterium]
MLLRALRYVVMIIFVLIASQTFVPLFAHPAHFADISESAFVPEQTAGALFSAEDPQVKLSPLPITLSADVAKNDELAVEVVTLDTETAAQLTSSKFAFAFPSVSAIVPITTTIDVSGITGIPLNRLALYEVAGCEWETITRDFYPDNLRRPATTHEIVQCERWQRISAENRTIDQQFVATITPTRASRIDETGLFDTLYVLASASSSKEGDYSFTPFHTVREYEVALNSGAMVTSYPIPVPPARAGAAPSVMLSYNSGVVDGMHQRKNNQPGSIGIGWSLQMGSITRHLKVCELPDRAPGDLCLIGDEYSITLNGISSRLVKENGNLYRLQNDPYWKVEKLFDGHSSHPDTNKAYWVVTTPDGTQYRFGGEIVPETGVDQNSVFYVPVYDQTACQPHNINWVCQKTWQWNLDRIEDSNANVTNFFYETEINHYDARTFLRNEYVRAGQISRIEYSTLAGQIEAPSARVMFLSEIRCADATNPAACNPAVAADFPDTPQDLGCPDVGACDQNRPTFWTERRIGAIQTQYFDEGAGLWFTAATYNLNHDFPEPTLDANNDSSEQKLWLESIDQHPGGEYTHWAYAQIEAENYDDSHVSPLKIEPTTDVGGGKNSGGEAGEYLIFKKVNFDVGATKVAVRVASQLGGRSIQFRLGSATGPLIATANVHATGGWQSWKTVVANVSGATGTHDLYVMIQGGGLNINWLRFETTELLSSLPAATYEHEMKANRRNYALAGVSPMYMPRIDKITTELGGVVEFDYGQSHPCPEASTTYIHFPYDCFPAWDSGDPESSLDGGWVLWNKWKITQQKRSDNFSGNPSETLTYTYDTPIWHYSDDPAMIDIDGCTFFPCPTRHWNDWRGSAKVIVTDASGAKTEHRFYRGMHGDRSNVVGTTTLQASVSLSDGSARQDNEWLRGQTIEMRRFSSGDAVLNRTMNEFHTVQTVNNSGRTAHFVAPNQINERLSVGAWKSTRTSLIYDDYGNVKRQILHGDLTTTDDDRNIERQFIHNTENGNYIVNRPYWERLWSGTESGHLHDVQSYTVYQYDNLGFNVKPTNGNVTLVRAHWATNPSDQFHETVFKYDNRGRQTHVTDANNRTSETQYHSFYGYAEKATNALNHTTTLVVHPAWGQALETTDPNGATTHTKYDAYGRLRNVWLADQTMDNDPATTIFEYYPEARPAYVKSRQLTDAGNSVYLDSWAYVDGFGRTIQHQSSAPNTSKRAVSSQQYNHLGQLVSQSETYELSGLPGSGYVAPNWNVQAGYSQMSYDDLGRPITTEWKDGATTILSTSHSYNGWRTTLTDANGSRTEQLNDAFGQLVEVKEYNGTDEYVTLYAYNLQGQLISVRDNNTNVSTMSYDLLGRKTDMNDPDMGQWYYHYDAVGSLVAQVDARNNAINFYYDSLNRLASKSYASGVSDGATYTRPAANPASMEVVYTYDQTHNGVSNKGRLVEVVDQAGTLSHIYDSRGRIAAESRQIDGLTPPFVQSYTYDAADRIVNTTYPNGEVVTTSYDRQGLPNQLQGNINGTAHNYISQATYNVRGQITQLQRGNAVNTNYTYHGVSEEFRLNTISSPNVFVQSNSDYDNVGNLFLQTSQYGSQSAETTTFTYDDLHRLATVRGAYNRDYGYDAIGNVEWLDGKGYSYSVSHPHAVSSVSGGSVNHQYTYDANGNMIQRIENGQSTTQVFDVENRLETVNLPSGQQMVFLYDFTGQRMRSQLLNGSTIVETTFYPFATYQQKNVGAISEVVPRIFVPVVLKGASTRQSVVGIQTKTATDAKYIPTVQQSEKHSALQTVEEQLTYILGGQAIAQRIDGQLYYLHRDHLGNVVVMTNSSGHMLANTIAKFYPFGDYRQAPTDSLNSELGFTGHHHNDVLGLIYMNARYYLPEIGRFANADTIVPNPANPQSLNRYSYVNNRPMGLTDPSGHCPGDRFASLSDCMLNSMGFDLSFNIKTDALKWITDRLHTAELTGATIIPYLDSPDDFATLTTGCGYLCQAG